MRLFVGIDLDQAMRAAAEKAAADVRRRLERAAPGLSARWVEPSNLHVTVRFIGQAADDRAAALIEALCVPVDVPAFDLTLGPLGVFPASGPPRAIWIGLTRGAAALGAVARELDARLMPFGFLAESRPFSPHLTLARVKDLPRAEARAARAAIAAYAGPPVTSWIRSAALFRSHLSPAGSRYEPLGRIVFAG